ncbi:MAG: T9SS type A sorting domain-containing protein [Flavobacteriales bacterium]|nr:T9SS type A sorting domain-containing protein [Flavobacteriales bacterium]
MKLKILSSVIAFTIYGIMNAQQWEQMANTPFNRDHGIGFSLNGMGYLLTGGATTGGSTKDFYQYDPNTNTWLQLNDYPGPNRGYGIGDTWDGKLYFGFGLNTGYMNDFWSYDAVSDTFEQLPSCPCAGRLHPALVAVNGKVFMGAGSNGNGDLNDWWEYDINTKTWTQKPPMPGVRHHPYQFEIEGEIYVGSGHDKTWSKYNVTNETWTAIADLDDRVAGTQFSFRKLGYALSGTKDDHSNFATGEFKQYDPNLDQWNDLPVHPGESRWAPSSFLIDGFIYLFGGRESNSAVNTMWRYDLNPPTHVHELQDSKILQVFPNPFVDEIRFSKLQDTDDAQYDYVIRSMTGSNIKSGKLSQQTLNLEQLPMGIYVVELSDGKNAYKAIISKLQ